MLVFHFIYFIIVVYGIESIKMCQLHNIKLSIELLHLNSKYHYYNIK